MRPRRRRPAATLASGLLLAVAGPAAAQGHGETSGVLRILGIPAAGAAGGDALRARVSLGYTLPHALLVLDRTAGGAWEGSAWLWSGGLLLGDPQPPVPVDDCDAADWAEPVVCRADPSGAVDWAYVGALVFDTLDAATLPDPSELPAPRIAMVDGLYLGIEVARDGRVRSLRWTGHEARDDAEARRAYALHRVVSLLTRAGCWSALPAPWPERARRMYTVIPPPVCPPRA